MDHERQVQKHQNVSQKRRVWDCRLDLFLSGQCPVASGRLLWTWTTSCM